MALAKLKGRLQEDRFEELAERIAAAINDRAARMTPEERVKADSETKNIATRVQASYSLSTDLISSSE
jgi:vacuolar-type H+-ATPase subunit E/Vma4